MLAPWAYVAIYVVLFLVFTGALLLWRQVQRRSRRPFPDELKLLRGPGETERRLVMELDRKVADQLLIAFFLPVAFAGVLVLILLYLDGVWQVVALVAALVAMLACLYPIARFVVIHAQQSANRYLGYFGERVVAEALEPLKAVGFKIFHDIPGGAGRESFNIDHVVIGSTGIFAIETKTRRKGFPRRGIASNEIVFDGKKLKYPWGEDRHGIEETQRHAKWLSDYLAGPLGRQVHVHSILTFPGWTITRSGAGQVNVLSPSELVPTLLPRSHGLITQAQIDLIARHLDACCRDVEY